MSRIAAFVSKNRHDLDAMARLMTPALFKGWTAAPRTASLSLPDGFLLTGGDTGTNAAHSEDCSVVFDGCLYNREDFSASPNEHDVALFARSFKTSGFERTMQLANADHAVVLYDAQNQRLWAGRDRFGIKPLYYIDTPEFFACASRPAALLAIPGVSRAPNRRFMALFAASHYRTFDNAPDESPFEAIKQLPAAHCLLLENGTVALRRYWDLVETGDFADDQQTLAEQYRVLLLDSVRRRFERAYKPAFTLSGGMDSSSVLSCAVETSGRRQEAFSSVYTDKSYDESDEIQSMLGTKVSTWHPVSIGTPDAFDLVKKMVVLHDEPVATATWLSHFVLCREVAAAGFDTLFAGLGGDELNAGEYEHFYFFFADLKFSRQEERLRKEVEQWAAYHDHPIFRKNMQIMEETLPLIADISIRGRCLPDERRLLRYSAALSPAFDNIGSFRPVMDHPFESYLKNRTYQDIFRETTPCCLRAEDRHTSALGLKNVQPFFDHRLVEFMFRIPGTLKIRNGTTKYLLREAMRGILPEETRVRVKKTGWNAPAHVWFSGPGLDQVRDLVASASFRQRGVYNLSEVERLITEHDKIVSSGAVQENHMMFLWQLVNLELWLRSSES